MGSNDLHRPIWQASVPTGLVLLLVVGLNAACTQEKESVADELLTEAQSAAPTPSSSPTPAVTPSPSPIPDGLLLAELRAIPLYPAAKVGDPAYPQGDTFSGQASRGFSAQATGEQVLSFYGPTLPTLGWTPDAAPSPMSWSNEGDDVLQEGVHWSFTKDDLRLLLIIDLTPKSLIPGELEIGLVVQPVWYPAFNTNGIPAPPADTTPIPIGPDSLGQ